MWLGQIRNKPNHLKPSAHAGLQPICRGRLENQAFPEPFPDLMTCPIGGGQQHHPRRALKMPSNPVTPSTPKPPSKPASGLALPRADSAVVIDTLSGRARRGFDGALELLVGSGLGLGWVQQGLAVAAGGPWQRDGGTRGGARGRQQVLGHVYGAVRDWGRLGQAGQAPAIPGRVTAGDGGWAARSVRALPPGQRLAAGRGRSARPPRPPSR